MLTPGTILSQRFEILRILGQGGLGIVYLARHRTLGTQVAIKELSVEKLPLSDLSAWHKVFEDEACILASLSHPGLARVTDCFHQDGVPYLIMEFIEGRNLEQEVLSRLATPSWDEVRGWALQLLDVLDYLHGRQPPVLVRDLKPQNIMVTPSGGLRVIDFGLARRATVGEGTATILKGYGSEGYAPLEQYRGTTTDPRSDLYALGATLLFCLSGQQPPGVDLRITQGQPLPSPIQAPVAIQVALTSLMEIVPDQRPATVGAARNLLGLATQSSQPSSVPSTLVAPVTTKKPGYSVLAKWMSAVLLFPVCVGMGFAAGAPFRWILAPLLGVIGIHVNFDFFPTIGVVFGFVAWLCILGEIRNSSTG